MAEKPEQPEAGERLAQAYERMLERVREFIDEAGEAGGKGLRSAYEDAKRTAVELGELTREESEKIATWIRRDARDAAVHLQRSGEELRTWLKFDLEMIESRLWDLFSTVADRTRVELELLREHAAHADEYRTGEVASPGTLVCASCGQALHLHAAKRIPPCPRCHHTEFRRSGESESADPED